MGSKRERGTQQISFLSRESIPAWTGSRCSRRIALFQYGLLSTAVPLSAIHYTILHCSGMFFSPGCIRRSRSCLLSVLLSALKLCLLCCSNPSNGRKAAVDLKGSNGLPKQGQSQTIWDLRELWWRRIWEFSLWEVIDQHPICEIIRELLFKTLKGYLDQGHSGGQTTVWRQDCMIFVDPTFSQVLKMVG